MPEESNPDVANKAANRRLRLPILILIVLVVATGCGAVFGIASGLIDVSKFLPEKQEPAPPKPIFKPMNKFVVGVMDEDIQRYMVLEMAMVSTDPKMSDQVNVLQPVLSNVLLRHFADRKYQDIKIEINNIPGLQQTIKEQFVQALDSYGYDVAIDEILLTNVVIQ